MRRTATVLLSTLSLVAALLVSGCLAHEEFAYEGTTDTIPSGPGLFSGDDGVLTIVREDLGWQSEPEQKKGKKIIKVKRK